MKRLYTVGEYREMLARCRERGADGVAVSSDFIVGFCGETDESFNKTMDLVAEAKFKNSFIFKYSERSGTKAAERYADDVPEETKKRRNNDLLAVQNANSLLDHRDQIGKTVEVLVEGFSRLGQKATGPVRQLVGRALTDHIVVFDGTDRLIGQTVSVRCERRQPVHAVRHAGDGGGSRIAVKPRGGAKRDPAPGAADRAGAGVSRTLTGRMRVRYSFGIARDRREVVPHHASGCRR